MPASHPAWADVPREMTRAASAFFWSMPELFASASVHLGMKLTLILGISVLSMGLGCALALAQEYAKPLLPDRSQPQAASDPVADPVPLDWVPPAMGDLRAQPPRGRNRHFPWGATGGFL